METTPLSSSVGGLGSHACNPLTEEDSEDDDSSIDGRILLARNRVADRGTKATNREKRLS